MVPKANKNKTCWSGAKACYIHKTKCYQNGNGVNVECPICGQEYEVELPVPHLSPEDRQRIINRVHGVPAPPAPPKNKSRNWGKNKNKPVADPGI